MARFALAAHERHGTHAVPHVIRSRRKKLLLAGLRALGPHMIGDTPVTLGERGPHLIGVGRGAPGWQMAMYVENSDSRSNELARAPLPHLREDPTDCRTHLLQVALGPLSPGIRKVHADDAAVVRVDVSGDQLFLQSGKHCGDAAGAGLQRLASCDGVMVPRSASSCRMNGSPCAPRANSFCILERLPHTLAYSSLSAPAQNPFRTAFRFDHCRTTALRGVPPIHSSGIYIVQTSVILSHTVNNLQYVIICPRLLPRY